MSTKWWPSLEEYNPNISKEKWLEILDNRNLTTEKNLHVLACFYNFGGEATCKQLFLKYGESINTFNSGASSYAEKLAKAKVCKEPPFRDSGNSRWWPVLFVGRDTDKETPGSFIWKLRDELKEACKEYGIEKWLNVKGEGEMNENIEKYKELLLENKNIILHGAPGTGKTFLAKMIAEAMGCWKDEIGFCQFHPSFDYTDFVEGLRPTKNNCFERKDGVFKEFCANAIENLNIYESSQNVSASNSVDVHELFSQFANNIEKRLMESDTKMIPFSNSMKIKGVSRFNNGEVRSIEIASSLESPAWQNLTANVFYRDYQNYKDGLITSYTDIKPLKQSKNSFHGNADYLFTLYGLVKEFENSKDYVNISNQNSVSTPNEPHNYVFIIDEINRGELSKIFGELFFSIDPGYRGVDENGKPKGLVNTQYQNLLDEDDVFSDGFYIPDNVYIIGTMNDIDRSVESMDFAMRRRFIFKEVTAEESAENMNITGEALKKMTAINNVISKMPELGKSYCIGAAYFKDAKDLQKLWDLKISSLVYEYLRGIDNYTDDHPDGEKFDEIKSAYNPESIVQIDE